MKTRLAPLRNFLLKMR